MLCCGGEKESARDLKSAQNTPSRQQMLPYSQQHPSSSMAAQHSQLGPPPLSQQHMQQGTRLGPPMMGGQGPHGLHHNQNMMNSFDHGPGAHKDDFRKVFLCHSSQVLFLAY